MLELFIPSKKKLPKLKVRGGFEYVKGFKDASNGDFECGADDGEEICRDDIAS